MNGFRKPWTAISLIAVLVMVAVTALTHSTHHVQVSWRASTSEGVTEYHVYRTKGSCPDNSVLTEDTEIGVVTVSTTPLQWIDSSVRSGKTYCYTVRAFNGFKESVDSTYVEVTVPSLFRVGGPR